MAACRVQRLGLHRLLLWEGLQVESQRMLLWAGKFGTAEESMAALNYRHFQEGKTASDRATVLEAATAAGLDTDAANAYLDTTENEDRVWKSIATPMPRTSGKREMPRIATTAARRCRGCFCNVLPTLA